MVGFYDAPIGGSAALEAQGTMAVPASTGEVLGAAAAEGLAHAFPFFDIYRIKAEMGQDPLTGEKWREGQNPYGPDISAEDANERYAIKGRLNFTAPLPEKVARERHERMRERLLREDIIARREEGGVTGGAARFAAGLAGSLPGIVDPLNIASAFFPAVGPTRAAVWAARAGLAGRAATGAIEGAVGGALLTPVQYGIARWDDEDYGAVDALLNIALGSVFGGGIHTGLGVLGRARPDLPLALDRADPPMREALLRGAVADVAEGRPVETPAEVFGYLPVRASDSRAAAYERVPAEPLRLASFLQREGGLVDEGGELRANDFMRQRPGLVNREGLPLDAAALKAWEEGYLPGTERPDINALLDALDSDLKGHPVYSERDHLAAVEFRGAIERNAEIDRLAADLGIPTRGLSQEEFYEAARLRLGPERAGAEAERQAAEHQALMRQAADEGWLPDLDTAPEEILNAYRQDLAARRVVESAHGVDEPEPVGRAAGPDETGAGPGGGGAGARLAREPDAEPGIGPERQRELTAALNRDPLQILADDMAALDSEIMQAQSAGLLPEDMPELRVANEVATQAEAQARVIEQGAACLGRRL